MRKVILSLFMAFSILSTSAFAADSYKIDPVHSSIAFSVKHMMVSNVVGQFDKYEGVIMYDPKDLDTSKIDVTIETKSINTHNDKRDDHLRSAEFFDAEKFPTIKFVSKKITSTEISGELTIKDVTKEVSVPAEISGPVKGMMGDIIGISATFRINRQDYGISYNKVLDQGGLAVGNEVAITIGFEAAKEGPAKDVDNPKAVKEVTKEDNK
jgi:polyisoprenoid-binding protein YceI